MEGIVRPSVFATSQTGFTGYNSFSRVVSSADHSLATVFLIRVQGLKGVMSYPDYVVRLGKHGCFCGWKRDWGPKVDVGGRKIGEPAKKVKKNCKFFKKVLAIINMAGIMMIVISSFSSYTIG